MKLNSPAQIEANGYSATTNSDTLSKIYSGIQEQIRFADSKAGFVAAFNAFLVGFIASNFGAIRSAYQSTQNWNAALWLMVPLLLPALPTAVSVVFLLWTVKPRMGANSHKSKVFFGHIARDYQRDGAGYCKDALGMTDEQWSQDYGRQIVEVASIASEKHGNVRSAIHWSIVAFLLLCLVSVAIQVITILMLPQVTHDQGQAGSGVVGTK